MDPTSLSGSRLLSAASMLMAAVTHLMPLVAPVASELGDLSRVLVLPTGDPDLPDPATVTLPQWSALAAGRAQAGGPGRAVRHRAAASSQRAPGIPPPASSSAPSYPSVRKNLPKSKFETRAANERGLTPVLFTASGSAPASRSTRMTSPGRSQTFVRATSRGVAP